MDARLNKKGKKLLWVGFSGSLIFNLLGFFATSPDPKILPGLEPYLSIISLAGFAFMAVMVVGGLDALKARSRHWAWVFLLVFGLIGVIIILLLKDKSAASQQQTFDQTNDS